MSLQYHYSIVASFLVFVMGLVFLLFGVDLLFFHRVVTVADSPPVFVSVLILFFGVLVSSGFLMNIIKGKNCVIEASLQGMTIFTKDINGGLPELFITWNDVLKVEVRAVRSALQGRDRWTQAIVVTVKPDLVKWPAVMITKNRIRFEKYDDYAELTIDAWLNKGKATIVKEIQEMTGRNWNA